MGEWWLGGGWFTENEAAASRQGVRVGVGGGLRDELPTHLHPRWVATIRSAAQRLHFLS